MLKFLLIAVLLGILVFFITRRLMNTSLFAPRRFERPGFIAIEADTAILNRTIKITLGSVGIGILLLFATLLLGMKIKILFFLLPISFYLLGHLFLLANHINSLKRQQIWFNPKTNDLLIEHKKKGSTIVNLYRHVREVAEIKAIQKNRGILFGYYRLQTNMGNIHIPFLLRENKYNSFFFEALQNDFNMRSTSVFFPFI